MATPIKNGNGNGAANGMVIPIGVAAAVIVVLLETISYLAWSTTNSNMDRIEKQASARDDLIREAGTRVHDRIENQLSARVLLIEKEFLRLQEHKEFTVRLDSQLTKMEERLRDAASRYEMDQRLGTNSASIIQVRNDIDALKRDLGQTYPLKEVMGNIQSRIDRIEQWTRAPSPATVK